MKKNYLNEDKVLLASLIKACRLQNDVMKPHLPICKGLLNIIIETVDHAYEQNSQPYLTVLFKALFVTAYYGLFRIGEITASQHIVRACDVHIGINKNKLMFVLHSSKTHDVNVKPQIIKIDSIKHTGKDYNRNTHNDNVRFCPFHLLQEYTSVCRKYKSRDKQFFTFRDGSLVTPLHFRNMLNKVLKLNKIDSTLYSSWHFMWEEPVTS